MNCCGDKIKKAISVTKKVAEITKGAVLETLDDYFILPAGRYIAAGIRKNICRGCESSTWMTEKEFWEWVDANGGRTKFFSEIDDLTAWPLLPKQEYKAGCRLMCRICKCWIGRKSQVKNATCPNRLWPVDK